jgi:hypothetical protein
MATVPHVDDELWTRFRTLVNLSSRELRDWLRTSTAGPDWEQFPDQAGTPTGQHVLRILGKRRTDLTEEDSRVMRQVVRRIEDERGSQPSTKAGDAAWRHRLMSLGHDPLKPV